MACAPLMAWRPKPGGRAGHSERADGTVFRTSIAGKRATSSGAGFRNSRLSRPTTKIGKTGSRAGRSARGVCPGGWRSEVTGEAEKPPERPGYPVNAEPASAGEPSMESLSGEEGRDEDAKRLWSGDEIAEAFRQGSWPLFRADAAHRQACLTAVLRDGFVVLRDVPREPGAVLTVAQSIGFVRETERGPFLDVQVGALPPSQAFTGPPLTPRTAHAFRDPPPTLAVLHCLDDAAAGGESMLVDGCHAAASLRARV